VLEALERELSPTLGRARTRALKGLLRALLEVLEAPPPQGTS
jgi:hypothetical protein